MRPLALVLLLAACTPQPGLQQPQATQPPAHRTADLGGIPIEVFTDHPAGCTRTGALIVFHGMERNAERYRDDARPLGQRACLAVYAPRFDEARFDNNAYQRGGIARGGTVLPPAEWTASLVPALMAWVRAEEGDPALPITLLGHSAGAQFLSRVAAFVPTGATRIVIADPSTWVWPTLDRQAPYGLGGIGPPGDDAALRRYLALPITVLLGGNDTGARNLARSRRAESQGATRLDRGENVYAAGEEAARRIGAPFAWHLVIVPGIAHDARALFSTDKALDAVAR